MMQYNLQALCLFSAKLGFHFPFGSLPAPFPHRFFPSPTLNLHRPFSNLVVHFVCFQFLDGVHEQVLLDPP